jgi:hypothetical protein
VAAEDKQIAQKARKLPIRDSFKGRKCSATLAPMKKTSLIFSQLVLLLILVITAISPVSANVVSGLQELGGGLHQGQTPVESLLRLGSSDISTIDALGSSLVPKGAAPNAQHAANLKRFQKKIPSNAKENVELRNLPNNGVAVQATSPGKVPGSKAVYEKQIDVNGKTIQATKTTYNPQGNIVHVKDKLNGGTYP